MLKTVVNIILIFIFVGLEQSGLPARFFLNPYICLIVFFALSRDKINITWPIFGGIALDYFSVFRFPIFTISFLGTFWFVKFVSEKIVTFRNSVSLVAFSFIGIFVYNLLFLIINSFTYLTKIENIFVTFNRNYFLYFIINIVFTFLLLLIFKKKYVRSVFHWRRK